MASQKEHPFYKRKMARVRAMLRQALPLSTEKERAGMLQGDRPHRIWFSNRKSTVAEGVFVDGALEKMVKSGAIFPWSDHMDIDVKVVTPLAVVTNRKGKKRLVMDFQYVNAFVEYQPVKYESLETVAGLVRQGWWLHTADLKSGYHHLGVREADWPFLAVRWRSQVYVLRSLMFGLSSACAAFTRLMEVAYRPLRAAGADMSFLIDDRLGGGDSQESARRDAMCWATAGTALGFCFGLDKNDWEVRQQVVYLGMTVNTETGRFEVPEDKVDYFLGKCDALMERDTATPREIAQLAGLLVSFRQAILPAKALARTLHFWLRGKKSWDEDCGALSEVQAEVGFWRTQVRAMNGMEWVRPGPTVVVVGDASDHAWGAFTPFGELDEPVQGFLPAGWKGPERDSTGREMFAALFAVTHVLARLGDSLKGGTVVYQTDSQAAYYALSKGKGTLANHPMTREIYVAAWQHQVDVKFLWAPRIDPWQKRADDLSRLEHSVDWEFSPVAVDFACWKITSLKWAHLRRESLAWDFFASANTAKAPCFFGRYWEEGAAGVDAITHAWPAPEEHSFAWVFPPVALTARALLKITASRYPAIVVTRSGVHSWTPLLRRIAQGTFTMPRMFKWQGKRERGWCFRSTGLGQVASAEWDVSWVSTKQV
ncbi:hypothetical protein [Pyruvatibacter sp.]